MNNEELIFKCKLAYRKLKHYVYHDTTNLLLRKQIALFETLGDVEEKLNTLAASIDKFHFSGEIDEFLKSSLDEIGEWALPKSFEIDAKSNDKNFFTNVPLESEIRIKKIVTFIKAPVEIHIISVLWILEEGYHLESQMNVKPFGYKLDLKKSGGVISGLKLFKPYFIEYQNWRDKAISRARALTEKGTNVAILGLDIKSYYPSIELDFDALKSKIPEIGFMKFFSLTDLLKKIHVKYQSVSSSVAGIPIGLLSSGVIANWYLKDFDVLVNKKINPVYYGRYVDDILIVLANPEYDKNEPQNFPEVVFQKFINAEIFNPKQGEEYPITNTPLTIHKDKISLLYFDSREPTSLLDNFEKELRENSSEFRFLPEEGLNDFSNAAYSINYSESKTKIRSIENFKPDKFGASKFLAKKIYAALQADKVKDKKVQKQILTFFKGKRMIEFYHLWEKVIAYFTITQERKALEKFFEELGKALEKIDAVSEISYSNLAVKDCLIEYFEIALNLAISLDIETVSPLSSKIINRFSDDFEKKHTPKRNPSGRSRRRRRVKFGMKLSEAFRKSNLIRHSYVFYPLLNYTEVVSDESISFTDKRIEKVKGDNNYFGLDKKAGEYSPRYVNFHEVVLLIVFQKLYGNKKRKLSSLNTYLEDSFDLFYEINYQEGNVDKEELKKQFLPFLEVRNKKQIRYIDFSKNHEEDQKRDKLRAALVNMRVFKSNMELSYLRKPTITKKRRSEINQILNDVLREGYTDKVDLVVFPETSIPYKWLNWMCQHSLKNEMIKVFGMEHWVVNKIAYNFNVTLLPVRISNAYEPGEENFYNAVIPIIRLKNHYSPGEIKELEGHYFKIPKPKPMRYDLINWRGIHFSVFNCFELADIKHRALFRSKVDLLIASEFNRDINYFSNLVESVTRDIHCYFIQSNNSDFGDNRITQPTKTVEKDLVRIKGGENTVVLIKILDFSKLRKFQLKKYTLQLDNKSFKPTPPGFDVEEVKRRLNLD